MSRLSNILFQLSYQHLREEQAEAAAKRYAEEELVDACTEEKLFDDPHTIHAAIEFLRPLRAMPGRDY